MSVQTEIVALTESTTALLNAVNTVIQSPEGTFSTQFIDASVTPVVTLPLSGVATRYFKNDSTAAHVTFDCTVGRTIEGQGSYDGLSVQNESVTFGLFDTDWKVIG
jgi:hypothetical protein